MEGPEGRTVILGLGNPLAGDDAVGPLLARRIGEFSEGSGTVVVTSSLAPVRVLWEVQGCRRLVVVDSIVTGEALPGTLVRLSPEGGVPPGLGAHHVPFVSAYVRGRNEGMDLPERFALYAVEIPRPREYGEGLSPALEGRLDALAKEVMDMEGIPHVPNP